MSTDSDNRQRILDAAHAVFAESGLAGLSVRAIAARAGLSTIGVYSHFKGKCGILLALYADGFARLGDAADIPPAVANGADLVGLLVNETHDADGDFEAVTKQDFLSWHIRHDSVIVIADAHCFVRSESVLHRLESCDAQKLTPGEER